MVRSKKMTLDDALAALEEGARLRREHKIAFFEPFPKQQEFFDYGLTKRERLLMAGNQLGKTEGGAFETACHLTGEYPDGWLGRRFEGPTRGWICGKKSSDVRDIQQTKLCGRAGVTADFGTGYIPKSAFADKPSLARGVTDAYDTIQVRHKAGGVSTAKFKSYEEGREGFQGEPVDWIWLDEECDMEVYSECLTRTNKTRGIVYMTFTPLKGMSNVVMRFLQEPSPDRVVINMTIDDCPLYTPEERARIIAGYPAHEREARARGTPMLGSGRVYTIVEETISEEPIAYLPPHWKKLWGIDFGIDHPFGAVLAAWDVDNDVIHVLHTIKIADHLALQHSTAMKKIAAAVPVAWPHDGHQRGKDSGEELAITYRNHGLKMLPDHAQFETGGYSREAAILEMEDRMTTGRFKVAAQLSDWFAEYRLYHRKDGQIVRLNDDLMSATEKIIMAKRFAKAVPLGDKVPKRRPSALAIGIDDDHWGI